MKRLFLSMALVALFACPALAEQSFDLGSYSLGANESTGGFFTKDDSDGGNISTSVTVSFDYFEPISDASWASDLTFLLAAPGGQLVLDVGGFSFPANNPGPWSFDGPGSTDDGFYSTTFDIPGIDKVGEWEWAIINDWSTDPNPNEYNNLTVTFGRNVPEPTSFMMFGVLGGLAALRRRS